MRHTVVFTKKYLLKLWPWYISGILAVLLTNWLSVRIPVELAAGLDALRAGGDRAGVWTAAQHIALLGLGVIATRTLSRVWFFTPARISEFELREAVFTRCLALQPSFYATHNTGDLLSRTTSDITYARVFAGFGILQVFNILGALGFTLGQMVALSPTLTAACVAPIVLSFGVVQLNTRRLMGMQRQSQVLLGKLSDELLGAIQGVGSVQAFCVEGVFAGRLDGIAAEIRDNNLQLAKLRTVLFPLVALAGGLSLYLMLAVGGPLALSGELSPGSLAAFVSLVAYLLFPMTALGFMVSVLQRAEASLERIDGILSASIARPEEGRVQPFPCPGRGPEIRIRGLTFGIGEQQILKGLDATIPAGATVGVFGRTGSGKSTLLRLIARLAAVPEGTIRIGADRAGAGSGADGVDLCRVDLDDWRGRVTFVTQTPFLFSETISENVGFGAPEPEVRAALTAAAFDQDLGALPDGLGTVVGERGITLSGGQRQRVALARGLRRRTELLLLDDVLSAVDHATEQELIRTLDARARGGAATTVIVSHRMSVLERTDTVLVMEEGRIVDQGSHRELLGRPGLYAEAWSAQQEAS